MGDLFRNITSKGTAVKQSLNLASLTWRSIWSGLPIIPTKSPNHCRNESSWITFTATEAFAIKLESWGKLRYFDILIPAIWNKNHDYISLLYNICFFFFFQVKLKCVENHMSPSSVSLFLLEPRTCEYILGVESPLICEILEYADENGLISEKIPLSFAGMKTNLPRGDNDNEDRIVNDDLWLVICKKIKLSCGICWLLLLLDEKINWNSSE